MAKANYAKLPINHSDIPIRLFKSDFLEFFTHIHPVTVLILFVPVVIYFVARALIAGDAQAPVMEVVIAYLMGFFVWTLSEYLLHRFLFHYEPSAPWLQRAW